MGGAARKPGRGQHGKSRCRARGICQGRCRGPPSAGSPGWRGQPPHPTLPCSDCRAPRGGVPALTPTSAQRPSSLLPPASTLWPPSVPETVSLLPWVSRCSCKPQPATGSRCCPRPGEPRSPPPFRDEPTEDPRGHSCALGSQLGSSRTDPRVPGGCGLSLPATRPLPGQDTPEANAPSLPWGYVPGPPGGRSSAGLPPAHPLPISLQVLPEPSS